MKRRPTGLINDCLVGSKGADGYWGWGKEMGMQEERHQSFVGCPVLISNCYVKQRADGVTLGLVFKSLCGLQGLPFEQHGTGEGAIPVSQASLKKDDAT